MWGCLKALFWIFGVVALVLLVVVGSGWWYLGTSSFEGLVKLRIEKTLEARLGRDVTIGSVEIIRTRPQRVILNDLRIANAPGGVAKYFATVRQVEISGGIESFWQRNIRIGRVDVRDPHLWFEVFPEGAPLTHNFPHWKSGPRSKYEIVHIDINKLFITNGEFSFLDRKHDIEAVSQKINSEVTVTRAKDLYEGIMTSPLVRVRLQDYEPFDVDLRGGFRYTPGVLALKSIALHGRDIEAFVAGKLDPLTEGVYDLNITSKITLDRVREIFRVEKLLDGTIALDTRLRGKQGEFSLTGGFISPRIDADAYTLTNAKGRLDVNGTRVIVDVDKASYGGGTIGAHYLLTQYSEPYPMSVELRYDHIAIEKLFSDWTLNNTGLRSAATGSLTYHWNKDKVLEGAGEGSAQLSKNAVAFSKAKYPIPVGGSIDFALNKGVVGFKRAELDTNASHISLTGSLRIEDLFTDLRMAIKSSDFAELDRIGYDFAIAADKRDYTLLGLGGSGTIAGSVHGPMKTPQVVAKIDATNAKYNNVLLGGANIDLRYDGNKSALVFDRAVFNDGNGTMMLTGTIGFPERGPSPTFDIAVESNGYSAQRAVDAVGLDFKVPEGQATGRLIVAGNKESGRVTFVNVTMKRADATLKLNGDLRWLPGEGNVVFDLDIAATNFPVGDIIAFLDLGTFPVTGDLTGTLHLTGPKASMGGTGSVTVRNGSAFGEPITLASADIAFTEGKLRATNVLVQAPAGEVRGEAEIDLNTEKFSYTIASSSLDLSRFKLLESLSGLLGGKVVLKSTGAGTFTNPELVVEATLNEATLRGLSLPEGAPPPTLYIAIRGGQLIVRGDIAGIVTIDGQGTVGDNLAVDGLVRITVPDIAKLVAMTPQTSTLPATGNFVLDLRLGGRLTPLDALVLDGTFPTFNLMIADHAFTANEPLHISLRNGRVTFESFRLASPESTFAVTGFAEITGEKRLDLGLTGEVEAALLQLFVPDVRANGHVEVSGSVGGTLASPRISGTAELRDAQFKAAGFPQLIDNINGTLTFRGDRIDIESLRATVGGGTVVLGGFIAVDGITPKSARITIQGTGVAIRYYEGLTVEGDFNLLLSGDFDHAVIQGDVNVTRALWFRDFDIQQALLNVILSRRGLTPITTATWQDRVALRVHLAAPGTLAIRNNIAEVTGSAELDLQGTVANPVVIGEVTLDEGGTVTIQNVDYRVVRGTIGFQNPFRIDPYLDITIEGRVSGNASEVESGPIDVTVNITGTIDRITPTITSDPPTSDITLFSILGLGGFTGGSTNTTGGSSASQVGTSLLYQSLFSAIGQRVFPFVDSFAYDPGLLDTGTGAGAKVTFEKRLSNNIRFLVVYNLANQQSRQVMQWTVNRDWTLQLTRDESDEYRVEARFRRRYDAQWEWGSGHDKLARNAVQTAVGTATNVPVRTPLPSTTSDPHAIDGVPVAQIEFRADANFDTTAMASYVTLKAGEPVSIRELQSSIKNLFATGNFRDVRVDGARAGNGAVITFSLFLNYRVGDINIDGLHGGDRNRALRELTMRMGDVLSLDAVDDSAVAIQTELNRSGFLEATVDPETTFDRARSLATVTFHVTPGPIAKVANVLIEGDTRPFTPQQLIDRMKRKPGKVFQLADARADADRMKSWLVRQEHRRADVDFLGHTYDPATHGVTLRYRATTGPKVKVEVTGIDRGAVRRWLPFRRRGQEYSEDAIDQAADEIVRNLQLRGYYNAAVDTESSLQNNVWTTTFVVSPGVRYRLADVTFSGNLKISDKTLAKQITTSPRGGIGRLIATIFRRPSGITRGQLTDDRDSLESYYRLEGFTAATVATPVVNTNDAAATMTVEFPITEGTQTLLTDVVVEGSEQVPVKNLPKLQLERGLPYNPQALREDVVTLQSFYAERGNAEVQVAPRVEITEDKSGARVTYAITEGPQIHVDEVIVRGNTYTDQDVVLRSTDLDSGDPFSYTRILEAQRDLYRLGIFNRVDIQPEQAGTTVGDRNIVIQVEEGKNLTITGAFGARATRAQRTGRGFDLQPRVAAAIAHRNLFGTGRYLGLEGVYSNQEREAFLTYREPFISRWDVPVQLQIFQTDDNTRPGLHILQRGTSIEATKVARARTRWSLRYEYKISDCIPGVSATDICATVKRGEPVENTDRSLLDIQISSITPTFFWDTRDDIIDPHRGFFTSASIEYAFPLFAADAHFLKEYVQGAWYIPLSARQVIALSGRAGLIHPYGEYKQGDVIPPGFSVGDKIPAPLSERFTAGGETTHRAFPLDRLGNLCRDEADFDENGECKKTLYQFFNNETGEFEGPILPLGGHGLLLLNAEYRFPIFSTVGGAVFADIGNVFADPTIRFDELRYGAGVGIRYLSPVGPLRFDLGFPFQRRSYERAFSYFITLGYAF